MIRRHELDTDEQPRTLHPGEQLVTSERGGELRAERVADATDARDDVVGQEIERSERRDTYERAAAERRVVRLCRCVVLAVCAVEQRFARQPRGDRNQTTAEVLVEDQRIGAARPALAREESPSASEPGLD